MRIFWATDSKATPVRHFTTIALRRYTILELGRHDFRLSIVHADDPNQVFQTHSFKNLDLAKLAATRDIQDVRSRNPQYRNFAPPRAIVADAAHVARKA